MRIEWIVATVEHATLRHHAEVDPCFNISSLTSFGVEQLPSVPNLHGWSRKRFNLFARHASFRLKPMSAAVSAKPIGSEGAWF